MPDGSLRLVDGLSSREGRVEVYHFGQWGTVSSYLWDLLDAIVVCRQLSYPTAVTTQEYGCNSSTPVWLSSVQCTGLESKLTQCKNAAPELYSPCFRDDAGVVCAGKCCLYLLLYIPILSASMCTTDCPRMCPTFRHIVNMQ